MMDKSGESKICFVYDLVVDNSGIVWLGTEFGLVRFNPLTCFIKQIQNNSSDSTSLNNYPVHVVKIDSCEQHRFIWLGTNGSGLIRFNMETEIFDFYTIMDGLSSNVIGTILSDDSGNLWLGTDRGISKVYLDAENREVIRIRNFDRKDGLKSINYCFYYGHNAFKNGRGEMFFAGKDGFNIFDPTKLDNPFPPPVQITNFQINFKPVSFRDPDSPLPKPISLTKQLTLLYDENTFSFELTALDFHVPEKNLYAYKLTGFLDEWINLGSKRTAIFTHVPPGEYTFHAKAANSDGVWNEKGTSLKIIITPPIYRTWWAYAIYVLLIVGTIYGLRRYEYSRREAKHKYQLEHLESQKLQELDRMKSRFFANISHEFRTPLTLILGPLEKYLYETENKTDQQNFTLMQRNAQRLLKLINELLDLSKLESGQMKLRANQLDIVQHLKNCLAFFESIADSKKIHLEFKTEHESLLGFFDVEKLQKIFVNLISNAIKFTEEGGEVLVVVNLLLNNIPQNPPSKGDLKDSPLKGGKVEGILPFKGDKGGCTSTQIVKIKISDTGIGIPKDRLSQIFNRFYQVGDSQAGEGSGIGLALTKELVDLHHGAIDVESEEGQGTTITVQFPLGEDHLKPEELLETPEQPPEIDTINFPDPTSPSTEFKTISIEQPATSIQQSITILIIEDNTDMRGFVRQNLESDYKVLEAGDGEQGINIAFETIPDLIISDVMMPKMNGFKVCQILKTDERTSHIPVILLTAKAEAENKIEGLETGADDYLLKPFYPKMLKIRIQNLLELRRKLRQRFSNITMVKPNDLDITSVDKKFLQRLLNIIESHLSEETFGVEELCKEIGMSSPSLWRKIHGLFNKNPNQFIRSIRLQHARQMLEKNAGNIAEICFAVGFSNPSYFARCFQEQYGKPPSYFKKKK